MYKKKNKLKEKMCNGETVNSDLISVLQFLTLSANTLYMLILVSVINNVIPAFYFISFIQLISQEQWILMNSVVNIPE